MDGPQCRPPSVVVLLGIIDFNLWRAQWALCLDGAQAKTLRIPPNHFRFSEESAKEMRVAAAEMVGWHESTHSRSYSSVQMLVQIPVHIHIHSYIKSNLSCECKLTGSSWRLIDSKWSKQSLLLNGSLARPLDQFTVLLFLLFHSASHNP